MKIINDIFLTNQIIFDQWYDNIKNFVFIKFWSYFDFESIFAYSILILSKWSNHMISFFQNIFVFMKTHFQSSQKTLQKKTIFQIEFNKQTNVYYKKHAVYKKTMWKYDKYLNIKIKLKNKITIIVFNKKKTLL